MKTHLSTAELAAEYPSVFSVSKLKKWRMTGGGPVYIRADRRISYDVTDVQAWITAHKVTAPTRPVLVEVIPSPARRGRPTVAARIAKRNAA
jgi:hypothetical protein